MIKTVFVFAFICLLSFGAGCDFAVREPGYTREQFVNDSTAMHDYMLDSLPDGSPYVSLGFELVKCDAFPSGRLVEHSFKSTGEVMPPVHQLYFQFKNDGRIKRIMTRDEFLSELAASGSPMYFHEPYE